mmetsp:Transcript_66044/g.137951  ORF Transcript_66044/g.137951 Transcript_66044/m.137951 type:complete len:263 (-) Transcript_66044:199-987(-)
MLCIVVSVSTEESGQLASAFLSLEQRSDRGVAISDGLTALFAAADALDRGRVSLGNDVVVTHHVKLRVHGCRGRHRGEDEVRILESSPTCQHAWVAATESHPLVLASQSVLFVGEGDEGGQVCQGLTTGMEFQRPRFRQIRYWAGLVVVAAIVAVLQCEHQGSRLLEPLDGNVAVDRVDHGRSIQWRALAADTEEDGAGGVGLEEGVVHIVSLHPGVVVGPIEVVLLLRNKARRRILDRGDWRRVALTFATPEAVEEVSPIH